MRDECEILASMVEYCENIEECMQFFGDDEEDFVSSKPYQLAVSFALQQIGELEKDMPSDAIEEFTNIPWRSLIRMRDLYAHRYHKVIATSQWEYIVTVPKLKADCQRALAILESRRSE